MRRTLLTHVFYLIHSTSHAHCCAFFDDRISNIAPYLPAHPPYTTLIFASAFIMCYLLLISGSYKGLYNVYRNPLHRSPFVPRASSMLWNSPFRAASPCLLSVPAMTSSRSPRSRRRFSRRRRSIYASEQSQPMAIYARMMPWPRLYQGLSRARYCGWY